MMVAVADEKSIGEIAQLLFEMTGLNRNAFLIKYIPEIPKNEAGKVIYAKLLEEF